MSQFGGSRSLFDDAGGDGEMFKSGDLLSEGFEDPAKLDADVLGEDVEGEALSRDSLISEEEEPPEGEGEELSAFGSRISQEDEPDEGEGPQAFTSRLAQEDPEDEGEGPQAFTSKISQEDEGPEVEGEGFQAFGVDSITDSSITDSTFDNSRFDEFDPEGGGEDFDLVGANEGPELEMEGFDF